MRLANLVSGNNTSLVLFYTSLQHTLVRPRAVAQHVASAPVRLRVTRTVPGPTHAAVMAECAVLAWPREAGPETVLVVLQALPGDCPRLGLDPRLLGDRHEVGVLAPWSEGVIPGEEGDMTAVFASRYLVAEAQV